MGEKGIEKKEDNVAAGDAPEQGVQPQCGVETAEAAEQTAGGKPEKEDAEEGGVKNASGEVEETEPQRAEREIAELKDKYLRTLAEFDNFRKRTLKEKTELILNGSERAVCVLLPVLDDLERAVASASKTDDAAVLKEGMSLMLQKFEKALESLGVKKIDTTGADFNVDYHEAIAMVPGAGDDKKGKVLDCMQAGYTINGKVIRHAKVAVGQ